MVPNLPMPDISKIAMGRSGLVFLTGEHDVSRNDASILWDVLEELFSYWICLMRAVGGLMSKSTNCRAWRQVAHDICK